MSLWILYSKITFKTPSKEMKVWFQKLNLNPFKYPTLRYPRNIYKTLFCDVKTKRHIQLPEKFNPPSFNFSYQKSISCLWGKSFNSIYVTAVFPLTLLAAHDVYERGSFFANIQKPIFLNLLLLFPLRCLILSI